MELITPLSASPGWVGVSWQFNIFPARIEDLWGVRVRLSTEAFGSPTLDLALLALEFWNNLAPCISGDWPRASEAAVTDNDSNYLAFVDHCSLVPPMGATATSRMNRATCVLIRGEIDNPLDQVRSKTAFLVPTWGAFPIPEGDQYVDRDLHPAIGALCDYLDSSPYLWVDKYDRKARCADKVRIWPHAYFQAHYYYPTPPPPC